ncbi:tRNA (adenosine(37)-N6)-dimethylallyltransferase MiaA [Geobacter luticola]|uniref:tRNA dimethylallyltransferase n=2 Tax=Geomobilimonas luticola TaxID=1114878 RepID=A0ABS5SFP9_9BACT|nr:tRNA (adenosine(37)-N6)-dimethylallyltransferase MiaA [Geomobilimonas luticola]
MSGASDKPRLVIILGPTASGKSEMAVELARKFDGEIVNADSLQVYRGLDIGTAKPSREIRRQVPHHLIDLVEPDEPFSAADFQGAARQAIDDIVRRGRKVFVVGGTGLYIKALVQGLVDSPSGAGEVRQELEAMARRVGKEEMLRRLAEVDPASAARLHPNDQVRIIRALESHRLTGRPISVDRSAHGFSESVYHALKLGIKVEREELYRRIDLRVEKMLGEGLVEEVQSLLARGLTPDLKALRSIGYKEVCAFLAGDCDLTEATRLMKRDTRHYAKRQLTWFKRDNEINWVDYPDSFATICNHVMEFYG